MPSDKPSTSFQEVLGSIFLYKQYIKIQIFLNGDDIIDKL